MPSDPQSPEAGMLAAALRYSARIVVSPGRTAADLVSDPAGLRCAVIAWLLLSAVYATSAFVGYLNGFGAVVRPWVPIPADQYYLYEAPLTPLIFLVVVVTWSGITQLLARLASGVGSFEATFSVIILGCFLPTVLLMWVPETLVLVFFPDLRASELGGLVFLPAWLDTLRQLVVPVWSTAICVLAVGRVHRISTPVSIAINVASLIPAAIVAVTYVR